MGWKESKMWRQRHPHPRRRVWLWAGCFTFGPLSVLLWGIQTCTLSLMEAMSSVAENHFHHTQPLSAQGTSGASRLDGHSCGPGLLKNKPVTTPMGLAPPAPRPWTPSRVGPGGRRGGCLPESYVSGKDPKRQAPQGRLWWAWLHGKHHTYWSTLAVSPVPPVRAWPWWPQTSY